MEERPQCGEAESLPTIHVISDSVGMTAQAVARAATAQFGVRHPAIETLSKARSFEEIRTFLEEHEERHCSQQGDSKLLVFFTLVNAELRDQLIAYATAHERIVAVDLMTAALDAISQVSGLEPSSKPGSLYVADQHYFKRIDAIEFTIAHDDGRNPQDLTSADLVLVGVSRTSKTPLSIYLAQQGYRVANVPLDMQTAPPEQLFQVERHRLYGLMTSADVLVGIRRRRLGNARGVAASYADPEYVYQDLEQARSLMRKLGCFVVHTENRAVEETAQEILRYYEQARPPFSGVSGS